MMFHYRQRIITGTDIPSLMINNILIEQVTEFNFLGLTVDEYISWNSRTQKIANKLSRTLGVMNRLKRYLPLSAMKLNLSHLQFRITNWDFAWDRKSKLQKCALRIMTNSRYNAHTEPLLKQLHLWKVKDIIEIQCLKFWCKYFNNNLPNYFRNTFTYNHELHDIETRNHDRLLLYPTRTSGAPNVLRHHILELFNKCPPHFLDRFKTHSLYSVSHHLNVTWLIYIVTTVMKSIAIFVTTIESEKSVIRWPGCCGNPLITDCGLRGRNNKLKSEHWHGVIDVTVFPYRSCTEATISFRHWSHWRLSKW